MHLPRLAEKEKTVAGQGCFRALILHFLSSGGFEIHFKAATFFATQENDNNHTLKITAALGGSRREIKTTSV